LCGSRCNLACRWCDTAYTWRFEGDNRPHTDGIAFDRAANQIGMGEEEVAQAIHHLGLRLPAHRLVITGGEPLLQGRRWRGCWPRSKRCAKAGMWRWRPTAACPCPPRSRRISTSSTSAPSWRTAATRQTLPCPRQMDAWTQDSRALFKFVIATPDDAEQVHALARVHAIPRTASG
jgi:hypothetical protein